MFMEPSLAFTVECLFELARYQHYLAFLKGMHYKPATIRNRCQWLLKIVTEVYQFSDHLISNRQYSALQTFVFLQLAATNLFLGGYIEKLNIKRH